MTIFMLNVYIFSMVNLVMDTNLMDDWESEYDGITQSKAIFIQVFRNSIGDIGMTKIGPWKKIDNDILGDCAMFIIWGFWFANVFTMTIVFLNFVIAEVGNTYNNIKNSGTIFLYQKKAEMNMLA